MLPNINPKSTSGDNVIDIDVALVREIVENRDRTAFTRLMAKYKNTVYAFCLRYTGNRQDAEDAAQEIFLKVYKNIGSFRGESKFSSWLYRITVNTCHNYTRWRRAFRISGFVRVNSDAWQDEQRSVEIRDSASDPEQSLLNKELAYVIRNAVARLKGKQKSVVILKDFLGRSYEEIASIMNMSMGSVKSILSRGRLKVANDIKEYDRL
jgi:RNA polymerase sigma-70 factor (ECF subfamily)